MPKSARDVRGRTVKASRRRNATNNARTGATEPKPLRAFVLAGAALLVLASARPAGAQVHWDASVQAGVAKRFLSDKPAGGADAGFGPVGQVMAHVALLPLVHVGGYLGHDISPLGGDAAARDITFFGARAKVMLPVTSSAWRAWGFLGFGYSAVYARSYTTTVRVPSGLGQTAPLQAVVQGAGGGFFEIPFGFGASYKLRKPWELCAELAPRFGFGHSGTVYEAPGRQLSITGMPDNNVVPDGVDRFGVMLTLGVLADL